jgi:class 3 adenylate cyclase
VDLNNTGLKQLKNLYLNRSHFARVTRNLASMGVAAQVYDYIFAARLNEENDQALIKATEEAGHVYFGLAFELWQEKQVSLKKAKYPAEIPYLDQTKWHVNMVGDAREFYIGLNPLITFPDLASVSRGLGSLSIKYDRDGVLRKVPLIVHYDKAFYPILPFRVICDYLSVTPEKISVKPGKHIVLKDARKPWEKESHDIVIPIDQYGNMIVNYIGPWERMDHYNFADILLASNDRVELELWGKELGDKIVVISDVSTGSGDVSPVPTDTNFPLSGVHANIMNGILTESFLRELSGREMLVVEVLLLAIVLVLSFRLSSLYFSLSTVAVAVSYSGIVSLAFFYGHVIFHITRPLLMLAFALLSIVVYRFTQEEKEKMESLRQRDFIRATFGRYLSNEVVDELLDSPEGLKMSGETREVTFLVSDLRGFAALSSKLSPGDVIPILNRYFERMVQIIARYRGTVDELQGDGILVFFGAPLATSDDPERAVACAFEMQNKMVEVNEVQRQKNLPELAMGIGLNTGEVIVGNIGSEKRSKYGAVGSAINTTYRIESYTSGGQILISSSTYEKVRSKVRIRDTVEVQFKGIEDLVILYDVVGIEGEYEISLSEKGADRFTRIEPPLPITCFALEGKTVSGTAIPGYIKRIGESAVEVLLEGQVAVHSNLKILLTPQEESGLSEVYAKLISLDHPASGSSHIRARLKLTWIPNDVKEFLKKRVRMTHIS